jgi:hypothetical protein
MDTIKTDATQTAAICSEEFFRQTVVLERKRTERSGRAFLVIFLDVAELLKVRSRPVPVLLESLASALGASTREIDVKGWYGENSLVGIICTEVNKSNRDLVIAKIKSKLGRFFDQQEAAKIKMHLVHYPEYENSSNPNLQTRAIPELQPERKGMFYS